MIPIFGGFGGEYVEHEEQSLITSVFPKDVIKALYCFACDTEAFDDNNEKAEELSDFLGDEFQELGTGTNRAAYLYTSSQDREFKGGSGLVWEFALDRRGFVDNFTEMKRSQELPQYAVKVYECNMLITVQEYVNLMDAEEFRANETGIKLILEELERLGYIFEDVGFNMKNHENWGYRENGDIVILDLGYVYPSKNNERAKSCPKCGAGLKYNANYTGFVCQNTGCRTKYTFLDVRRRMNLELEEFENKMILEAQNCKAPDFENLHSTL